MPQLRSFYEEYPTGPHTKNNLNVPIVLKGLEIKQSQLSEWYVICQEIFSADPTLYKRILSKDVNLRYEEDLFAQLIALFRERICTETQIRTSLESIDAVYNGWVDSSLRYIMRQAKSNLVRRDNRKSTHTNSIESSSTKETTSSLPSFNLNHQTPSTLNTANKIPIHIRYAQDPSRDHKEYLITFRRREASNKLLAELQGPDFDFQRLKDILKDPNESRMRFNPDTERLMAYIPTIKSESMDDIKSGSELIEIELSSDFRRVIQAALNGDLAIIDLIVQSKDSPLPSMNTTSQTALQYSLSNSAKANIDGLNLVDNNSEPALHGQKSSDEEEDLDIILPTEKIQAKRLANRQKQKRDRNRGRSVPYDTDNESNSSFKSADGFHKPESETHNSDIISHLGSTASIQGSTSLHNTTQESTSQHGTAIHFQDKLLDALNEENKPEQVEDESDEDFEERLRLWKEARADIASMKLQAQLESKICEQLDEEKWLTTCGILHHNPNARKSAFIVQIHGMKYRLSPYQAHNIIRTLMMWNTDVGSTFQAHEMGLGKTLMSYTTCYLQHTINCMWDDIQQNPADHLSSDQEEGEICPSNHRIYKQYGLDCPCTKAHETSKFKPSLGIHIIMVPLGLLTNWIDEWDKFFDENNPLKMQLVVAHGNAKGAKSIMNSSAKSDMFSDVDLGDPGEPSKPVCTPKLQNSRIVCLTTSNSISKQLFEKFEKEKVISVQKPPYATKKRNPDDTFVMATPKPYLRQIKYTALTISTLWRDEAHKEHLATSATLQALKAPLFAEKRHENIHYNPMSGTLITSGPMDVAEYLIRMKRPSWDNHKALKSFDSTELMALGKAWDKNVKEGVLDEEISQKCIDLLRPIIEAITLRFTAKSNFLGEGPIVLLPPNIYSEISCQHKSNWQERLQIQKQKEDAEYTSRNDKRKALHQKKFGSLKDYIPLKKENAQHHYRSRLYASFPFLMDIAELENEDHIAFTEKEWIERVNSRATKKAELKQWDGMNEPFRKYIKEIAASSGKLVVMKKSIDEFKDKTDPKDSKPCRMIFASYFFIGARILYLWMIHVLGIPEEDIVFLDKVITSREFDRRLELWHGQAVSDNQEVKPKQPRYMVATSMSFGVGLTLSEAVLIALLEPDYSVANELQTFSRHDRIGNCNKKTYSHLYFIEDNDRENLIRKRNHVRKGITKTLERKVVNLQNIKGNGTTREDAIELGVE